MAPEGEGESAAGTAVGASVVIRAAVVRDTVRAGNAVARPAARMRLGDPAVKGSSARVIVGDHPVGVNGAVAMAAVADNAPLIGIVSSQGFLR